MTMINLIFTLSAAFLFGGGSAPTPALPAFRPTTTVDVHILPLNDVFKSMPVVVEEETNDKTNTTTLNCAEDDIGCNAYLLLSAIKINVQRQLHCSFDSIYAMYRANVDIEVQRQVESAYKFLHDKSLAAFSSTQRQLERAHHGINSLSTKYLPTMCRAQSSPKTSPVITAIKIFPSTAKTTMLE
jgi:hypothetical protein